MSKGKNKAIAERRKEALQELGSLVFLQRKNSQLEKENRELRDQLAKSKLGYDTEILFLKEDIYVLKKIVRGEALKESDLF